MCFAWRECGAAPGVGAAGALLTYNVDPSNLMTQVEEGLCQLVALLWLDSQDGWAKAADARVAARVAPAAAGGQPPQQQQRLASYLGYQIRTDTSDAYGEGFRIAHEAFQQRGLAALVEDVCAARAWPSWGK